MAGSDERLAAAMEAMAIHSQAMMAMMTAQTEAASSRAESASNQSMASLARSIDTKGMLKLDAYHGEKEKFVQWKTTFYSAISAVDMEAVRQLKMIESKLDFVIDQNLMSEEESIRSRAVATFLLNLCKDDALDRVIGDCGKGFGYEAWRKLCE